MSLVPSSAECRPSPLFIECLKMLTSAGLYLSVLADVFSHASPSASASPFQFVPVATAPARNDKVIESRYAKT